MAAAFGPGFIPVGGGCQVLNTAFEFQISAVAVALAASYYQRLVAAAACCSGKGVLQAWDAWLDGVVAEGGEARFVAALPGCPTRTLVFVAKLRSQADMWPMVVYAACLHIAVKMVHHPHTTPRRVGRYSFRNLLVHLVGIRLHAEDVAPLESWVLRRLKYDLLRLPAPTV